MCQKYKGINIQKHICLSSQKWKPAGSAAQLFWGKASILGLPDLRLLPPPSLLKISCRPRWVIFLWRLMLGRAMWKASCYLLFSLHKTGPPRCLLEKLYPTLGSVAQKLAQAAQWSWQLAQQQEWWELAWMSPNEREGHIIPGWTHISVPFPVLTRWIFNYSCQ